MSSDGIHTRTLLAISDDASDEPLTVDPILECENRRLHDPRA
jgi:hypothetical protein